MAVERVPYQVVLRAIGAYLDEHAASAINVIETDDGFAVRYQRDPDRPDLGFGRFSNDDLVALKAHLEWHRTPERRSGGPARSRVGYQDFFRALGYELDQIPAYDVLLDEVEDDLLLTYLQLDPAHGVIAHKRMIKAGPAERQEVLESARGRRQASAPSGLLDRLAQQSRPAGGAGNGGNAPPLLSMPAIEAPWEIGERQLYGTQLKNAWTAPKDEHGPSELVLTNRRIMLRFNDGTMYRAILGDLTDVSTDVRRELLSRQYRVELHRADGERLNLDCLDQNHMEEVTQQIASARADAGT